MVMFMKKGELYKLLRSKSVKVLFILLLILNSLQIIYVNYQNIYGDINTGKRKILKIIQGPISQQKYDWLVNYHNTMLEQVNNGNYNTKNKSKNTFSGYVFGDEQISNNLLEDYEYTINYHSSIKNKITILDENIKKTQNSKWKKENIMLKKRLKNRNLSYHYDYTLINNFMNQDFQYLLSLIFCIILVIKLFIYEKQKQTDLYFYISRKQIKKIFISKILMILLFTFISSLLLLIESYLIYYFLGMKNGLFQPLYALSHFMYEPYNISIFFYIVCNYFFRLVGCLSFSYLFLFLCHFLNKEYKGFFIAILIIYISIQLYNNNLLSIISFSSLNDSIYNQRIFMSSLLFSFIILNLNFFTYFLFKRRYYVSIN